MHSFKILPKDPESDFDNSAFCFLNKNVGKVIAQDVDLMELGQHFDGVNLHYLSLHHLSLNPGVALKRIGCNNTDPLLQISAYNCGFLTSGTPRYSLVPLGIVVNEGVPGLKKYRAAFDAHAKNGARSEGLHLLTDGQRFAPEMLQNDFSDDGSLQYQPTRFEQLYLGSGYTREMLGEKLCPVTLQPVGLNLDNGDMLLAYAYSKHAQ